MSTLTIVQPYLKKIKLPAPNSHKGQNGKLLIIGGSELFHAASRWSLEVASKIVDMVFYSSIPINNQLIYEAKQHFTNGIVIPRQEMTNYLQEADAVLIGPGMERSQRTEKITNQLLKKYPNKKWVIDAGALQMIDPQLIQRNCILTPHQREMTNLKQKIHSLTTNPLSATTILLKGPIDQVIQAETEFNITGGNAGLTKGGTGDVLAGLVAALYCTHDALTSAIVASYINKKAADKLYQTVGPYFNASDLANKVPEVLWQSIKNNTI